MISYGSPQKLFYNYRNNLVLLLKNEQTSRLLWLLPWRLVLDGVSAAQLLAKGQGASVATIFKAHMSFYGSLRGWLKKRRQAQAHTTTPNRTGIYPRSIVWDYFARGKKRFSELGWKVGRL